MRPDAPYFVILLCLIRVRGRVLTQPLNGLNIAGRTSWLYILFLVQVITRQGESAGGTQWVKAYKTLSIGIFILSYILTQQFQVDLPKLLS
jgi:hypothetical protein